MAHYFDPKLVTSTRHVRKINKMGSKDSSGASLCEFDPFFFFFTPLPHALGGWLAWGVRQRTLDGDEGEVDL
jgi:hypothetical protein